MPEKFLTEDQKHRPLLLTSDSDSKAHVDYVYFYKEKAKLSFKKKVSHISDGLSSKLSRHERKSCMYHWTQF